MAKQLPGGEQRFKEIIDAIKEDNSRLLVRTLRMSPEVREKYLSEHGYEVQYEAVALTRLLTERGYDALLVKDFPGLTDIVGGNQIVVFNPKKVVIIKP